jgi:membrane-associated phospholipid phosphatase
MIKNFDDFFKFMTKPVVVAIYLAVVIVSFIYWDRPVTEYFFQLQLEQHHPWLLWITRLAWGGLYIVPLLILTVILRYIVKSDYWKPCFFLWLSVIIPSLANLVAKVTFGRSRPTLWLGKAEYGFHWFKMKAVYWSFPSGHTITMMGFVFGLSVLYPRYLKAFIIVGLLIVSTRILLLAHFVSDVMIATYLAMVIVYALTKFLKSKARWAQQLFNVESR